MPAGIGVGQLVGLVRDTRARAQSRGFVAVVGPGATQLAEELAAGGDAAAARVGAGDEALALVVLVEGQPGPHELDAMRGCARAGTAVVAVRVGASPAALVPYVLPEDVIDVDRLPGSVEQVARALARALGDRAAPLAGRLPALRPEVRRLEVRRTALESAMLAASPSAPRPRMPQLTLAEGGMLLRLELAGGGAGLQDPAGLARASVPPLAGALAAGLAFRELYRRLPRRGALPAAAVAYAGTRLLGEVRARLSS